MYIHTPCLPVVFPNNTPNNIEQGLTLFGKKDKMKLSANTFPMLEGLTAMMDDRYPLTFTRESGEGCYDLLLMPKAPSLPGILIYLKAEKDCDEQALTELAEEALRQIEERKYDTDLTRHGVETVLQYERASK